MAFQVAFFFTLSETSRPVPLVFLGKQHEVSEMPLMLNLTALVRFPLWNFRWH